MKIQSIEIGQPVVYIPKHKLNVKQFSDDQLGIVTSKNDTYVFVRYIGNTGSQATNPFDLFPLTNRPDLQERLGIEIKPTSKINEIYLQNKEIKSIKLTPAAGKNK